MKYNSCKPSLNKFDTNKSKERVLGGFLSFNDEKDEDSIFMKFSGLDKDLVPFAITPNGDAICFKKKNNSIILWNHETDDIENISSSFTSFLNSLY